MRINKIICILAVLLLFPAFSQSSTLGYLRISLIEGDVQIKTPDAGDWGFASINGPLAEGDQVWIPQGGRVELQLNTGSYIRLDQESALQILRLDRDSSQVYLSQGHAYIFHEAPGGGVIQIDTPDGSTRAFDAAIFRTDVSSQNQYTDVGVYKGYVETENRVGTTRTKAGQMLSIGENTNGEVSPMGPPDEWERWNKGRNDRLYAGRGPSSHYLPPELTPYSYDFDNSGRWVEVPNYGYCWTPTVVIGANWAPYRHGRWIWRGGEYVWVPFDPWGWAPYHYGRWAFVAGIGWCWVPPVVGEVYWGPGYVGWVRTADYVAWVPLAPGEIYYGRGHYGRDSVNITNINVNQVNITNVYKNVYVNNGVTVVGRDTFATASPRIVNVNQDVVRQRIFTRNNMSVGTPDIRPTRASYFASSRTIPPAKLPPQPLRNVQVKDIQQSRPFMKEPHKSVLNPGASPQALPVNTVTTPRTPGKGRPTIQHIETIEKGGTGSSERHPARRGETQPAIEGKPVPPPKEKKAPAVEGKPTPPPKEQKAPEGEKGREKTEEHR